ncbi:MULTISPECIES: hypothetical protein [Halobacterium]|uniref:hypothetical protein n=1 Tax=Halobacterium TaxID=2239 RepID=UPI00073E8C4C|nr:MULTISPECIES: hypothetical protein [Halobacterium]MCG1003337.1 hypothetical protein [Halobacterium noricense]
MTPVASVSAVVAWAVLTAGGYAVAAGDGRQAWARDHGSRLALWLGALSGVLIAVAAGLFSVWEQAGVYVLAAAGVLGYGAGVTAAAGAAGLADAATGERAPFARRVRAFWYAAGRYFRETRAAFVLAFVAFALAAIVAGVAVDPVLRAVGSFSVGAAFASLTALAATGTFVPGSYDEDAAERVRAVH